MTNMLRYSICVIILLFVFNGYAQQLAFPEAEGFARYVTGGRGGEVYHVTNLNDDGAGSFRDAVSQSNRIVVFDVGGVINIDSRIVIKKNITIAGQTAPGQGITIYGNGIALNNESGNNIIRHIRFRMGKNGDYRKDALGISDGQGYMFDHVSITWGWDGTVDVNGTAIDKLTFQDCIIGQGIDIVGHSTGGLMQSGDWSVIRSLFIDNETRNPKAKGTHEFINSVVYNWGSDGFIMGGDSDGESFCNMIGNYFIYGPSSSNGTHLTRANELFHIYKEDNWVDSNKDGIVNGSLITDYLGATIEPIPYSHPGVNNLMSAQDALNYVIDNVGASRARDEVDEYLINELKSFGTIGSIIHSEDDNGISGGVGTVHGGSVPTDTDQDGMPDEWETLKGLNINDPSDRNGDLDNDGYLNLEEYLNELALQSSSYTIAPSKLTAEVLAYNQIKLTWQDNSESESGYYLERSDGSGYTQIATIDANVTTYTDNEVSEKTSYTYRMKSFSGDVLSDAVLSNEVITFSADGTPLTPVLTAPQNNSTNENPAAIELTWSGGLQADYFEVYLGKSENSLSKVGTNITTKLFVSPELDEYSTYYWRVDAVNNAGTTSSETYAFSTKDLQFLEEVAYYAFEQTEGLSVVDSSAYGNNGTAVNITPAWQSGKLGNAINLAGGTSGSGVEISNQDQIAFDDYSFSVAFWVKADAGTNGYLFNKGFFKTESSTGAVGKWFGMESKNGKDLYFSVDDDQTKTQLSMSNETFFTGEWVHVVAIRNVEEDQLEVYLNGTQYKTTTDNSGNIGNDENMYIGNCTLGDTNFPGSFDEFHLYNYVLSQEEIEALKSAGIQTGADQLSALDEFIVFPNPFESSATAQIRLAKTGFVQMELFDVFGKKIQVLNDDQLAVGLHQIKIDGADLARGLYIVKLTIGDTVNKFKLFHL
jgi:hypothetical protein